MKKVFVIARTMRLTVQAVLLVISFFIGIGCTSFIMRLIGKKAMLNVNKSSSWKKPTGSKNMNRMY